MTVDKLKKYLTKLGVSFKSKANKVDLEKLVKTTEKKLEKEAVEPPNDESLGKKEEKKEKVKSYGYLQTGLDGGVKITNVEDVKINGKPLKRISLVNGTTTLLSAEELEIQKV